MEKFTNKLVNESNEQKEGLERYPEFAEVVGKISDMVINTINEEKDKIESEMPYKAQFILEEVIKSLKEKV